MGAALLALLPNVIVSFATMLFQKLLGVAPKSVEADAQAQKDRADNADALLKAKVEGDAISDSVGNDAAAGKLRKPDKFQLKP